MRFFLLKLIYENLLSIDPSQTVRVPGFWGSERRKRFEDEGVIEIEDADWEKFSSALNKVN